MKRKYITTMMAATLCIAVSAICTTLPAQSRTAANIADSAQSNTAVNTTGAAEYGSYADTTDSAKYSTAANSSDSVKSLTLEQCIDRAVLNSINIKQQELSQQKSEITLNTAKNSRLPDLNGSTSQQFSFGRSLTINNTYSNYNTNQTGFNLGTSIPIFSGMRVNNTIELAKLDLEAATEDLNAAKEDLAIQVTQAYLQVLFNLQLHEAAKHQTDLAKKQQQRLEAFFNEDKATASQLADAKSLVAQRQLSEIQSLNDYKLALLQLSQLLELDSPENLVIAEITEDAADTILDTPDEIFNISSSNRSNIKAAELRIKGAEKSIKIAQSAYYPRLDMNAGIGTGYYHTKGTDANKFSKQLKDNFSQYIGLNLSIPIFNKFSTRNNVRQAKADRQNSELTLISARKQLYKEIQQAYYNSIAAQEKYASSKVALEAAETAFNYATIGYENGKSNATQYAEASTNLLKATSDMLQAKYDYIFRNKIINFYKGEAIK